MKDVLDLTSIPSALGPELDRSGKAVKVVVWGPVPPCHASGCKPAPGVPDVSCLLLLPLCHTNTGAWGVFPLNQPWEMPQIKLKAL